MLFLTGTKNISSFQRATFCSTHSKSSWQWSSVMTSKRSESSVVGIVAFTMRHRAAWMLKLTAFWQAPISGSDLANWRSTCDLKAFSMASRFISSSLE